MQRLGDRPWLMGKGFYTPSLVPLFATHEIVPLSLFTFSPTNAMSSALLIDIAPTRWFRGSSVDSARICNVRSEQRTETAGHSRRVK